MAEGTKEGDDEGFSFVDKVRLMMYGEQEKVAFLIDKKEKEEKKKAKKLAKAAAGQDSKQKEQSLFGQVKSFFTSEAPKEDTKAPSEETSPATPDAPASSTDVTN